MYIVIINILRITLITLIQAFNILINALVFVCIMLRMLRILFYSVAADAVYVFYHGEIKWFTCVIIMQSENFYNSGLLP